MRSVIRSIMPRRQEFGKIVFLYGARHADDFPFIQEIGEWRKAGIEVILCVSRIEGAKWDGVTGHVQDHFAGVVKELSMPVAMICGMKEMQQQSRDELVRLGVLPDEVLTNY